MFLLAYDEDTKICGGFYKEGFSYDNIPSPNIQVDKKLWKHMLGNSYKIKGNTVLEQRVYTLKDFNDIFELVSTEQPKPLASITDKELAQMTFELANKDLQIQGLEAQQAQALLESAKKDVEIQNLQIDIANVIMQLATQGGK
ncbi:hypothetical protein UMC2_35221 [[Clostridium] sordellii]|uniref:hypothetical protein n=1 Tax=Paraclostridium sordellii TaxID=1505 RepID=UPI00054210B3|nr:hypothetical protein [Paeniclostridium sordellii]CEK34311.1 hypothetical protein UMC2_35221 [[Clostridium] sordellii] [Paeniclostridium sordellii]